LEDVLVADNVVGALKIGLKMVCDKQTPDAKRIIKATIFFIKPPALVHRKISRRSHRVTIDPKDSICCFVDKLTQNRTPKPF
jgi:hypothetical protein